MLSIQNHFLDSNIILSIIFEDSKFDECREYYKLEYKRYISDNIEKEILTVIAQHRFIALKILTHIKNYMSSNYVELSKLDYHMKIIKKSYLSQFKDDPADVLYINKNKFLKIAEDLFIVYYDKIRTAIIEEDIELKALSLIIKKTFKKYYKDVNRCLTNFEKFSFTNNQDLIKQLITRGIHEKDAILVDDCYNKSKDMDKKFVFVTNDNGIIECSQSAFELLDSKIHFAKPSDFLNN